MTKQDRALDFYVGKLGFEKRRDIPAQQLGGRWIEVTPPGAWPGIPPMFELHDQDGNRLAIVEAA